MGFWKDSTKTAQPAASKPEMNRYVCNNDECDLSLTGEVANRLAYGCFMCAPPARYSDLPKGVQEYIPIYDLSLLWSSPLYCREHQRPLRPCCPSCFSLMNKDGNIPPIGIWGFGRAGKTVYCAALMMEFESRLFKLTGMAKEHLFNRGKYEDLVVAPLKNRGIIPAKTQVGEHHSLSLKLYRQGWFRKKVTFNDVGGENYLQWFESKPEEAEKRRMVDHMLRAREAIFLMSPESAVGVGATVKRDLFSVTQRVMEVLHEEGCLAHLNRPKLEKLLREVMDIVNKFSYLFVGGGAGFEVVAEELAALVMSEDSHWLVSRLDNELMKVDEQLRPMVLDHQLDGLTGFLNKWGSPGPDHKHDLRLAITIGKADLLPGISTTIGDAPVHESARKAIQEWQSATYNINHFNESNTKRDWQHALRRVSAAGRQVLLAFGETQFVRKAEENFRDVGFFFVSSLGRDVEPFLDHDAAPPAQTTGGGEVMQAVSFDDEIEEAAARQTRPEAQWKIGKRLRISRGGYRRPEPLNTLWPLLWILIA